MPDDPRQSTEERDLGLGSRVASTSTTRFLNRDGSFNVHRAGLPWLQSLSIYHTLLTMPAWKFYGLLVLGYGVANVVFGFAFYLLGPGAIAGSTALTSEDRLLDSFFFSVHTLATIGYGSMSPHGVVANLLVTVEAMIGLLGVTLATGLSFARFSRPSARILFSDKAVVAPYRGGSGFMFRIINMRKSQLIEVRVQVVFSRMETVDGRRVRQFSPLGLERSTSTLFPLHWTVVHPIDDRSPMNGMTSEQLASSDAEFIILVTALEETFSQSVHARSSYKGHEVVFGAKFRDMFLPAVEGKPAVDVRQLHEIEAAALPSPSPQVRARSATNRTLPRN